MFFILIINYFLYNFLNRTRIAQHHNLALTIKFDQIINSLNYTVEIVFVIL